MTQLLQLLSTYCKTANIKPHINSEGKLDIYPIFLEANKQGLLSTEQFNYIKSVYREGIA